MPALSHEICGDAQRIARMEVAARTAVLPVTAEMAWTVPQLLKRMQFVSPDIRSTTGALRALMRMPERDAHFLTAFADSGFLSCDRAIERVRWKYDIDEMAAKYRDASGSQVLEHCRCLVARDQSKEPFDWDAVLVELRKLNAWFPELRTIEQLAQLYTRLHALHVQGVHVARCWLDRSNRTACAFQGVRHA